ncbi:MAG: hypothetical protein FWB80_08585 [Defluviitaleaceae bacterium]|nr:hypothetical protein [Defluviitaleaceae bacterium]
MIKSAKWELIRWFEHFDRLLALAAGCIAVVLLLPTPREEWHIFALVLVLAVTGLAIMPMLLAVYMILVYPFVLIAFTELMKVTLLERANGRSVVGTIITRVLIGLATAGLGVGIYTLTLHVLRPTAEMHIVWVFEFTKAIHEVFLFNSLLFVMAALFIPSAFFGFFVLLRVKAKKSRHISVVYLLTCIAYAFMEIFGHRWVSDIIITFVAAVAFLAIGCVALDSHAEQEADLL